jgi:hypothetical protein
LDHLVQCQGKALLVQNAMKHPFEKVVLDQNGTENATNEIRIVAIFFLMYDSKFKIQQTCIYCTDPVHHLG